MMRAVLPLLGVVLALACGGTRGPDAIALNPASIEAAARVLAEVAASNPDFAFEERGFRVRASTYHWMDRFEAPSGLNVGLGNRVRFKALTDPRITWWRLEDICAVRSQEWLFSAAVEVHLDGQAEPWLLEVDDPEEARRIVNAIDLLMRSNQAAPDVSEPPAP